MPFLRANSANLKCQLAFDDLDVFNEWVIVSVRINVGNMNENVSCLNLRLLYLNSVHKHRKVHDNIGTDPLRRTKHEVSCFEGAHTTHSKREIEKKEKVPFDEIVAAVAANVVSKHRL